MTSKTDFTEEEWARLKRAPFVAGMAISLADPGGPIEAVKETAATLKTVRGAEGGDRGELVAEMAREVVADAGQEAANAAKEGGFMGFHAERVSEGEQRMLDSLREVLSD